MIRVLIFADWSGLPARYWNIEPDDSDWAFFQNHTNVGDTVTITTAGDNFTCIYEVLSKDPVPVHD